MGLDVGCDAAAGLACFDWLSGQDIGFWGPDNNG